METLTYTRIRVYDGTLRLIHAWNGITILCLILTVSLADLFDLGLATKTLWLIHIYLGYALVLGLVARLVWGVAGPHSARFTDMWHPRHWWRALRTLTFRTTPRFGHDVLASGIYITVYIVLLMMMVTGLSLAAIEHSMGPATPWLDDSIWLKHLFKTPHELGYDILIAFTVIHISALIRHEKHDQTPIAQAMVSGYQYRIKTSKEHPHV
ncbi:MAG: cytochrome b/b6 domain-containing protein [Sulfuriferula sp.]